MVPGRVLKMSSTCVSAQGNWSNLPPDLLELISSKLSSIVDLLNEKGVCSSWGSTMVEIINRRMLRESMVFFGISGPEYNVYYLRPHEEMKLFRLMKKSLEHNYVGARNLLRIIGSHPDGWLIIVKNYQHICLHNLVTDTSISIPVPNELTSGPGWSLDIVATYQRLSLMRAILSHDPSRHPGFVMVMILSSPLQCPSYKNKTYCFWRYGDRPNSAWTSLEVYDFSYIDIAFCNYTLYTLKVGSTSRVIETWDFRSGLPIKMMNVPLSCASPFTDCMENRLVLSPSGEIFIAAKDRNTNLRWGLLKVDLSQKTCVESNSLNGGALLYGDPSLLLSSIDAKRLGIMPNSIYFVDYEHIQLVRYNLQTKKARQRCFRSEFDKFRSPKHMLLSSCWMNVSTPV